MKGEGVRRRPLPGGDPLWPVLCPEGSGTRGPPACVHTRAHVYTVSVLSHVNLRVPERRLGYGPKWPRPAGPPGQAGLGEMLLGEGLAGRWGPSAPQRPGWWGSCSVAGSFVRGSRGGTQPSEAPELGRGAGCGRSLAVTAFSVQARGSAFTNGVIKEKAL